MEDLSVRDPTEQFLSVKDPSLEDPLEEVLPLEDLFSGGCTSRGLAFGGPLSTGPT